MKTIKPLIIYSKSGNKYFYDDVSQLIVGITNEEEDAWIHSIEEGAPLNESAVPDRIMRMSNNVPLFQRSIVKINPDPIIHNKLQVGTRQLILEVTDSCNLRCKYCIFSDHYSQTHSYGNHYMSFDTAKKIIDFYFEHNIKALKSNPFVAPAITFYGGEPLLNFSVIKKVVYYVKEQYSNIFPTIEFGITTNGVLLKEDVIQFLTAENFLIVVSLDGDRDNHDRNRVTEKKEGSYDTVITNLKILDQYDEKNRNPYILAVVYDFHDSLESRVASLLKTISSEDKIGRFNFVDNHNCDYYTDISSKKHNITNFYNDIWNLFITSDPNSSKYRLVEKILSGFFVGVKSRRQSTPRLMRGACVVGLDKLFVSWDGTFYACEKVSQGYALGNVESGFDIDMIKKQVEIFNVINEEYCFSCSYSNLCGICIKHLETSNSSSFKLSQDTCLQQKKNVEDYLQLYISTLEREHQHG